MNMASITFDKLAYTHTLRSGGFSEQQAEACAHALDNALRDAVATKGDLQALAGDLAATKLELSNEIAAVRSELEQGLAAVRSELEQGLTAVRSEMSQEFAAVRSEMAQESMALRSEMASMKAELKHDIVQQKADLLKWIVPLFLGQAALIGAMIKLL